MLESKRRAMIFIGLSILLAAIAGFMFLKKVQALNTDLGSMAEVYVASGDISSRAELQPDQVEKKQMPKQYVSSSNITDKQDLIHKVSVVPLSKGDTITKNMLKSVSDVRDKNDRLISMFASDKIGFDQELEALDRVDIIVSKKENDKKKSEYFMQDVKVAMVASKKNKFKGVLLEVPSEEAPKLIQAQNYADSIRILKANVGEGSEQAEKDGTKEKNEKTEKQKEEKEKAEKEKDEKEKAKQKDQKKKDSDKDKKKDSKKDKNKD